MSVLKNKRSESAIKVITQGDKIVAYTLRMLCNESIFPKKSRKQMNQYYSDLFGENPTVKL